MSNRTPMTPPVGVFAQDDVAGGDQPGLLAGGQGDGCGREGGAGFDLDDRQDAGLFRHGVDLAGLGAQAAGADGPAVGDQGRTGGVLGGEAGGIGGPASFAACVHRRRMAGVC